MRFNINWLNKQERSAPVESNCSYVTVIGGKP
jgi:hypothetical protein